MNTQNKHKFGFLFALAYLTSLSVYAQPFTEQQQIDAQQRLEQTRQIQQQREAESQNKLQKTPDVRLDVKDLIQDLPDTLPTNESPCFVIREIHFKGDSLVRFGFLRAVLNGEEGDDDPVGKCLGSTGIRVLIKRAQDAVVTAGFVTTRIVAEPQDLTTGIFTLTVLPGLLGDIRFTESSSPRGNLHTALPSRKGDILNLRDIEQGLENFKRAPTANADFQIVPGTQPTESDLVIHYTQATPFRINLNMDDAGSKSTGKYQASVTLSYDNALTLNDLFYISWSHDLGHAYSQPSGTQGYSVHYSVPYGYGLFGTTASKSNFHQTVKGATQDYVYNGNNHNLELFVSRMVQRDSNSKTQVRASAFQRRSANFIDDIELGSQRRIVGGWTASVNHKAFIGNNTLEAELEYKRGTGAFGALPAPEENLGTGTSRFGIISANANFAAPFKLGEQMLRYQGNWRLQAQRTPLTIQDQFSIGSRYTVRGFTGEQTLTGERGWLLRNELAWVLGQTGQSLFVAIDHGQVGGPSSDRLLGKSLTGSAIGWRGSWQKLQYEFFIAMPIHEPAGFQAAHSSLGMNLNFEF